MHSQKWGDKQMEFSPMNSLSQPTSKIIRPTKTLPLTSGPIGPINLERISLQLKYEKENFPSPLFTVPVQKGKEFDAIQCLYSIFESFKKGTKSKTQYRFNSTFSATYIPYFPERILIESSDRDECESIIEEAIKKSSTDSIFSEDCIQNIRELNSSEIIDSFCYPIQYLPLSIGSIVRIKDPEFQNEPAQIVNVNCQTGNIMVKMYGHIDYDTLIQYNYTSQKKLNIKMPNNYRAKPAPFDESFFFRHSAKIEIKSINIAMAPDGVADMIYWDGNYYYDKFMYIEFPITSIITQNLNITESEFQRFQDSHVLWEIINENFRDNMNRTVVVKPNQATINININSQPIQESKIENSSIQQSQPLSIVKDNENSSAFSLQSQPLSSENNSANNNTFSLQRNLIIDSSPLTQQLDSPPHSFQSSSPPLSPIPSPSPPPKEKEKKTKSKEKTKTKTKETNNKTEVKEKKKTEKEKEKEKVKEKVKEKEKEKKKVEKDESDDDDDLPTEKYIKPKVLSNTNDLTIGSTGIIVTRNLPCKVYKIMSKKIIVKPDPVIIGGTINAFKEIGKHELSQIEKAKQEIEQSKVEKKVSKGTQVEENPRTRQKKQDSEAKRKKNILSILSKSSSDENEYYYSSYDEDEEDTHKSAKEKPENDNTTTKNRKFLSETVQTRIPSLRQFDLVVMKNGQVGVIIIPENSYKLNVHLVTNKILKDIKESDVDKVIPDQGYVTDKCGQQICLNDTVYCKNETKTVIRMHNKKLFVQDFNESNRSYAWIDADESFSTYISQSFTMENKNSLIGKTVHRILNGINSQSFRIEAVTKKGYLIAAGNIKFKYDEIGKKWDFDHYL